MTSAENPYAGQGPVLLDIGDTVGALVVRMPPDTEGLEVEIRPASTATGDRAVHPHVAVVGRPSRDGVAYTLVYPAVVEGEHELVPLPDGPVVLTVTVTGGRVTRATWPSPGVHRPASRPTHGSHEGVCCTNG